MSVSVLIIGAGTGAANNLVASLRSSIPDILLSGCHTDPFILKKSAADRNHLLPAAADPGEVLVRLAHEDGVRLVIPTGDQDVVLLAEHRDRFGELVFLPSKPVIDLCQDKLRLATALARHAVPVPLSAPIPSVEDVQDVVAGFGDTPRMWCRMRAGTRSLGATPVSTATQVRSWLALWQELRGVPATDFMLAEYLPGRDFLCQGLWRDGRLVLVKTFERLSYFGGENSPSGVSSLSSLAKTVVDERVVEVCERAVEALDPDACGAFSIDLKENARGVPCITEINAGRFFIGMTAFDHIGKHNMSACFVRLALGEQLSIDDPYDCPPDYYLVRDLDTLPGVFHADEILDGPGARVGMDTVR